MAYNPIIDRHPAPVIAMTVRLAMSAVDFVARSHRRFRRTQDRIDRYSTRF